MISGVRYYTTKQAADILGMSANGVLNAIAAGAITSTRRGKVHDVDIDSVEAYRETRDARERAAAQRREAELRRKVDRLDARSAPAAPRQAAGLPFAEGEALELLRQQNTLLGDQRDLIAAQNAQIAFLVTAAKSLEVSLRHLAATGLLGVEPRKVG